MSDDGITIANQPRRISQKKLILLGLLLVLGLSIGLFFAIRVSWLRRNPELTQPFVGTWKWNYGADDVGLIDLRADGTARWRFKSGRDIGKVGPIGYMEWTVEGDELILCQYSSRRKALLRYTLQPITGKYETSRRLIVSAKEDSFALQGPYKDPNTGKLVLRVTEFQRVEDELLQNAN